MKRIKLIACMMTFIMMVVFTPFSVLQVMAEGVKKGACQLRQTPFEGGEGENQNFRNQVEM